MIRSQPQWINLAFSRAPGPRRKVPAHSSKRLRENIISQNYDKNNILIRSFDAAERLVFSKIYQSKVINFLK